MPTAMSTDRLTAENRRYRDSGGVSRNNRCAGFRPAFKDHETGRVYPSCNADGTLAPFHRLDGLPSELVIARDPIGRVIAVKACIEAGFEKDGQFFTRAEAAAFLGC